MTQPLLRRWPSSLVIIVLALACASLPVNADTGRVTVLADTTWGDLIGLSQDEVRMRLGLTATGETMASFRARLDGRSLVIDMPAADLVRAPCRKVPSNQRALTTLPPAVLSFRDGKLERVHQLDRDETTVDLGARLRPMCTIVGPPHTDDSDLALLPLAVFTIPSAMSNAAKRAEERDDWRVFSELRLGQSPPGGAERWAAKHRDVVEIERGSDQEVRLNVKVHTQQGLMANHVLIRDDQIVELRPWSMSSMCLLRADGSLNCGQAAMQTFPH